MKTVIEPHPVRRNLTAAEIVDEVRRIRPKWPWVVKRVVKHGL